MFFTGAMRYIDLTVFRKDLDATMDLLGTHGCLELSKRESDNGGQISAGHEISKEIDDTIIRIAEFLELAVSEDVGSLKSDEVINQYFSALADTVMPLRDRLNALVKKEGELKSRLADLEMIKKLGVTSEEMARFAFLYCVVGTSTKAEIEALQNKISKPVYIRECGNGLYLLLVAKKQKWELESGLNEINFKVVPLPEIIGRSAETYASELTGERSAVASEIAELTAQRKKMSKELGKEFISYMKSVNYRKKINDAVRDLAGSDETVLINGWIENSHVKKLLKSLDAVLGGRFYLKTTDPSEMEEVRSGAVQVPVTMKNPAWLRPFEFIVFTYGTPEYNGIDPTFFVTCTFLLFYGMMFGDVGQGGVIALIGLLMWLFSKKTKDFGKIIFAIGVSAVFFGLLYGSMFCFEREEIGGILTPIEHTLFGVNRPYVVDVSPSNSISVFTVTIAIGFIVNMFGMVINIINGIRKNRLLHILFAPAGVTGLVLLGSVAFGAFEMVILKTAVHSAVYVAGLAAIGLLFIREPLVNAISGKKLFHEGIAMWIVIAVVELFEAILNVISNNLSFIRIGAFTFAHGILSSVGVSIAESLGIATLPGVLVIIFFNLLLIFFEGMIVAIQTLRLEYYEFFSKFFGEQGRKFIPFKIDRINSEAKI